MMIMIIIIVMIIIMIIIVMIIIMIVIIMIIIVIIIMIMIIIIVIIMIIIIIIMIVIIILIIIMIIIVMIMIMITTTMIIIIIVLYLSSIAIYASTTHLIKPNAFIRLIIIIGKTANQMRCQFSHMMEKQGYPDSNLPEHNKEAINSTCIHVQSVTPIPSISAGNNFSLFTGHMSFQTFLLVGHLTNWAGHKTLTDNAL